MSDTLKAPDWMDRCDDCGWPLLEDRSAGCHEFDCSFRPQHGSEDYKRWKAGQSLTFEERKQSRDYIRRLETRIRNLEPSAQTRQKRPDKICIEGNWTGDSDHFKETFLNAADSRQETPMCQYHDEAPKRCLEPVVAGTEHCKFHSVGEG